ncbi:hypothetical protein VTO73DRAFT_14659 [Trametes versicolor]
MWPKSEVYIVLRMPKNLRSCDMVNGALVYVKHEDTSDSDRILLEPIRPVRAIQYEADDARARALEMVNELAGRINTLPLGSNLRKDEFTKTVTSLRTLAGAPSKTLIAFCGPTGAGKSTLINALLGLGENVVPTSAIQACTAVVTEIAYNPNQGLKAEIEYLTPAEWKEEVNVLLEDIRDPTNSDTTEEVEIARAKVKAVFPSVSLNALEKMTADELLAKNSALSIILGSTLRIVDDSPTRFSQELSRYLDSQEGFFDTPANEEPSVLPPAYWPLIRQVRIFVHCAVLSSGAVLVDLPGAGDSNAARNRIAQSYMTRADRFFIVAPIARAVSNKVAAELCGEAFKSQLKMDGKYHAHAITFIATKCDDIPCQEIIRDLKLASNPDLKAMEKRIKDAQANLQKWEQTKANFDTSKKNLDHCLRLAKDRFEAAHASSITTVSSFATLNRAPDGLDGALKRARGPVAETSAASSKRQRLDRPAGLLDCDEQCSSDVQQNPLLATLSGEIRQLKDELLQVLRAIESADISIDIANRKRLAAIADKDTFCAAKRSEWATAKLRGQFRAGLEEMEVDDMVNDQSVPDRVDDDLAVFTVSARAQIEIESAARRGEQHTLGHINTRIPELRLWIDAITRPTRETVAEQVLQQTKDFARCIETWIDGIPGVSLGDRDRLKACWRSKKSPEGPKGKNQLSHRQLLQRRYQSSPETAIIPALLKVFQAVVDGLTGDISARFGKGLKDKCRASAGAAAAEVVKISEDFATRIHHLTYRATIRRKGLFRKDLNAELAVPFTRRIARSWSDAFASNLLGTLEERAAAQIELLLGRVVASVPAYLQPRAQEVVRSIMRSARRELRSVRALVRTALDKLKTDLSQSLSPLVQSQLAKGYEDASLEVGRGSSRRQKAVFNAYLEIKKHSLFIDTTTALEKRLEDVSQVVGETLDKALEGVARTVEVNVSILWEGCPLEGEEDNKARMETKTLLADTVAEVDRWLDAKKHRDNRLSGSGIIATYQCAR